MWCVVRVGLGLVCVYSDRGGWGHSCVRVEGGVHSDGRVGVGVHSNGGAHIPLAHTT